jgi:probable addiction module antidote protein
MTDLATRKAQFRSIEELEAFFLERFEGADAEKMLDAIGTAAKAYGIAKLATVTGRRREKLYSALSAGGNPGFKDVVKILRILGFDVTIRVRQRWTHHTHSDLPRIISDLQAQGVTSLHGLANALTELGLPTAQGFGAWSPSQVSRLLARIESRPGADLTDAP